MTSRLLLQPQRHHQRQPQANKARHSPIHIGSSPPPSTPEEDRDINDVNPKSTKRVVHQYTPEAPRPRVRMEDTVTSRILLQPRRHLRSRHAVNQGARDAVAATPQLSAQDLAPLVAQSRYQQQQSITWLLTRASARPVLILC